MAAKLQAIPLPELRGKSVLDVGCEAGFWCRLAADRGAMKVVGLDRGREVNGRGYVDFAAENMHADYAQCSYRKIELGKQWQEFGQFDVIFLFSLYHHIFQACGDHLAIWFWLWRHMKPGGELLWENPVSCEDAVVQANVSRENQARYSVDDIFSAADVYFTGEFVGPALHESTREVWRLWPRPAADKTIAARITAGAGGASKAFEYDNGRRSREIETILGFKPYPGSLNMRTAGEFDWSRGYVRAQILDVEDRKRGLRSSWASRWMRFYPLMIENHAAYALRFEGEKYPQDFVELIAPIWLRKEIKKTEVALCRPCT